MANADNPGAWPQLVVRNTFLELFDDSPSLAADGPPGRPRAQTDFTGSKVPQKVEYPMEAYYPAGHGDGFGGCAGMEGSASMGHGGFPMMGAGGMGVPYGGFPPPWWGYAGPGSMAYPGMAGWGYPPFVQGASTTPGLSNAASQSQSQSSTKKNRKGGKNDRKDKDAADKPRPSLQLSDHLSGQKGGGKPEKAATSSTPRDAKSGAATTVEDRPEEAKTTVMLRNIPNRYTQQMVLTLLEEYGFAAKFDFVYLPMDFRNGVNLGYAFVNLLTHEDAMRLMDTFQGFSKWYFDSAKVCEVSWAHPHQGFSEHVERYRNSPVMHTCMPDEYKPMIFQNGVRVQFPPPTKALRAPKLRPVRDQQTTLESQ